MNTFGRVVLGTVVVGMLMAGSAWAEMQKCKPSQWGPDDEIGAANRITPESVLAAAQLIKTGKTYSLGITIDSSTPAFSPRTMALQIVQPGQQDGKRPFANGLVYNDDIFQGWFGIGPQLDGLGHAGWDGVFYNCNKMQDFAHISGVTKLGIEKIPPMVARGVVLDMAGHFGVKHMEAGKWFTADDIKVVAKKQGVELREGDVILFHTGWTENVLPTDPKKWIAGAPGMSEDAAEYLATIGPMAVGSDTWGLDVFPPQKEGRLAQGHITLIQQEGIYILETMDTGPLVRDEAWEFLFVLGQAKVKGAVQMIINPVAIR
jgi:kynurenine formamidase